MKTINLLVFGLALLGTNLAYAQTSNDTLYYQNTFWHGNSLMKKGKHVSIKEAKELTSSIPEISKHFKTIKHARTAGYSSALGGGLLLGIGLSGLLVGYTPIFVPILSTAAGAGVFIGTLQMTTIEKEQMIEISKLYNQQLQH